MKLTIRIAHRAKNEKQPMTILEVKNVVIPDATNMDAPEKVCAAIRKTIARANNAAPATNCFLDEDFMI